MYKEIIISAIVIMAIFGLNYITQNNTDYTIGTMKQYLGDVRQELAKEDPDFDTAQKKADEAYHKWEELDDRMAFYIEHDELEKVKTAVISMQSFVEAKDEAQAIDAIDRCVYILDHINEKEKMSWDNIF